MFGGDYKLSFRNHIVETINKAKGMLINVRNVIGKMWGTNPKITIWAYNAMIKPMLAYGAIIWSSKAKKYKEQLSKLQRLAMLLCTWIYKSTPT